VAEMPETRGFWGLLWKQEPAARCGKLNSAEEEGQARRQRPSNSASGSPVIPGEIALEARKTGRFR